MPWAGVAVGLKVPGTTLLRVPQQCLLNSCITSPLLPSCYPRHAPIHQDAAQKTLKTATRSWVHRMVPELNVQVQ